MREDTDQLIRHARQTLDAASALNDDQLAPNAGALADAALYLHDKRTDYPNLGELLHRYLKLAAEFAEGETNLAAAAGRWQSLASTWPEDAAGHHQALARAGSCHFRAGRFGDALGLYERAAELALKRGDENDALEYRLHLAASVSETGHPQDAYDMLRSTIARANAAGLEALSHRAATNAAITALFLGKPDEAAELAARADEGARNCDDLGTSLRARQVTASIHALRGNTDAAVAALRSIAGEAEAANLSRTQARALGNIGATLIEAGDMQGGREALVQAHELFVQQGDLNAIAHTCMNLGAALCEEGLNEKATGYLEQAHAEFARMGDVPGANLAGINLAGCLVQLGRLDEAERKLGEERRAGESAEVEVSSAWFETAGGLEAARGRHERALEHFGKALKNAEQGGINVYVAKAALGCARSARELERHGDAFEYAMKAVRALDKQDLSPRLDQVEALSWAAHCARGAGRKTEAQELGTRALELADELPILKRAETPRAQALVHELRMLQATAPVQR